MVRILSQQEQTTGIETRHKECASSQKRTNLCKELKGKLIKEIVKKTFIELAVSLLFVGAACFFVATPIGMITLLVCAVAAIAINVLIRSIGAYCMYRLLQLKNETSVKAQEKKILFEKMFNFMNYMAPITFSTLVDDQTRELIVHEGGHALAANILIKDPRAQITIDPMKGGKTTYYVGALTKVGEFFGRANSKLIIAAAGPALSVITATIGFGASLALRKSNPELSRYLQVVSIGSIAQNVFYAFSALWTAVSQKGHDFLQLMAGGLHPIAAVVSIVALPILVRLGFFIYDKIKEKIAAKAARREAQHINKEYTIKLPPQMGFKRDFIKPALG